MSRSPSARLGLAALGAALLASAIPAAPALAGGAGQAVQFAAAAEPFRCQDAATIWRFTSDFKISVHPHNEPERGWYAWGAPRDVVDPFRSTTFAGPGNVVYNVAGPGDGHGELRRFQFNGTGWDTFNGRPYEVVATGLTAFGNTEGNARITADSTGDVYTVDGDGNLRWHAWNAGTKKVDFPGVVVEPGWGGYTMITAGGPGVLYARTADGKLHRHAFHPASQRRLARVVEAAGWQRATRIFAAGGDVVYAVRDDGALLWHRYQPESGTWAAGSGTRVGNGWQHARLAFARNDSCVLDLPLPVRATTPQPYGRAGVFQGADGKFGWVFADSTGLLVHHAQGDGDITSGETKAVPGYQSYTGAFGAVWQQDGQLRVIGQSVDGEFRTVRRPAAANAAFSGPASLGGWTPNPATVVRVEDLIHAFTTSADGHLLHRRQQAPNSDNFTIWQNAVTGADAALNSGAPAVIGAGSGARIIAVGRDGAVRTGVFTGDAIPTWQVLPGVTADGAASAVRDVRGRVKIFVRGTNGIVHVLTQRADDTFGTDWRPLNGMTAAGSPAAVMDSNGTVYVFSRGADEQMYVAAQQTPGSATFAPWSSPFRNQAAASDPSAMTAADGRWMMTFRDVDDVAFAFRPGGGTRSPSGTDAQRGAATPSVVGGRVGKVSGK